MAKTIISWTDFTFNPWMGCAKVSDGCKHCYAETLTRNRMGLSVWGPAAARNPTKSPWQNLRREAKLARDGEPGVLGPDMPRLVFCGSLMDWAEDRRDLDALRDRLWDEIRRTPELHYQLLTKRPENIERFLPRDWGGGYPNVWLGTSVEDARVSWRRDAIATIPAAVRFLSYEPALGPLDGVPLDGIDWVIYGGESGPGWRPEGTPGDPKCWARSMRDRCREAGVAYFHKQSAAPRTEQGVELDGTIIHEFPCAPRRAVARALFPART